MARFLIGSPAVVIPAALAVEVRALVAAGLASHRAELSPAAAELVADLDAVVAHVLGGPVAVWLPSRLAADRLGVTPRRVLQLVDAGSLRARRQGRRWIVEVPISAGAEVFGRPRDRPARARDDGPCGDSHEERTGTG
jgi:hypothetical protein